MSNANVALIQSLYDAYRGGDLAPIIAALAPDVSWHSHGRPTDHPALGPRKGLQSVQEFFATVMGIQELTEISPREYYAVDDKVIVRGRYVWTIRKTGGKVAAEWVHIFGLRDGLIASFEEFTDTGQFAEALRA